MGKRAAQAETLNLDSEHPSKYLDVIAHTRDPNSVGGRDTHTNHWGVLAASLVQIL